MSLAPIALFAYKRLPQVQQVVVALRQNALAAASDLIIFSDAPKGPGDQAGVQKVRDYLQQTEGFKSIRLIERETNMGLAASIIDGVGQVLDRYGKVIVLEDDLVVSPYFLQYMNEALDLYADQEQVVSIHGYTYPVDVALPETFFLKSADCWGWATWQRGWTHFNPDAASLLSAIREQNLTKTFDFGGQTPYTKMLERQVKGEIDSWAICWYASAFLKGLYTLYPGKSLVQCVGNDGSGQHCEASDDFQVQVRQTPIEVHPVRVEQNQQAYQAFSDFFKRIRPHLGQRIWRRLRRLWQ